MASIEAYYGKPAMTVRGDATVTEAAEIMTERHVGALVVTDDRGRPIGLVSERELIAHVLVPGRNARLTRVSDVALRNVESVSPREDPARCSEIMKQTGVRHLLVREGDKLAGVVSMRDVIRALLEEREWEVRQLTGYITGTSS